MNLNEFILIQHEQLHAPEMSEATSVDSVGNFVVRVLEGLGEADLRTIPAPEMNSLAWIFWHLARTEDVLVNRIIAQQTQVMDDGDWFDRLGVPFRDNGTGMSPEDVATVSSQVNLEAVMDYRNAVGRQSREITRLLSADQFDELTQLAGFEQAVAEGAVRPSAAWLEQSWVGRTTGYMLGKNIITHNALHLGEALAVKSRLGFLIGN